MRGEPQRTAWAVLLSRHALVQLNDRVEVPRSADLDHVVITRQDTWKWYVRFLGLHDPSYRVIDLRHAAGDLDRHRLHGTVASKGDGHEWISMRPLRHLTDRFDPGVELDPLGPCLGVLDEVEVGVSASEQLDPSRDTQRSG